MKVKAHWTVRDFQPTSTHIDRIGPHGEPLFWAAQQGVCRQCGKDMQRFAHSEDTAGQPQWQGLTHYNSRRNSRTSGIKITLSR